MEREPNLNAIYKHLATPGGEHWKFRRSTAFLIIVWLLFIACILVLGMLAIQLLAKHGVSDKWVWPLFFISFWLEFVVALWPRTTGSTTLTVNRTGRVCFGKRELCPAGTVRAVCIAMRRRKVADWQVYLELEGGNDVLVPPAYLGDFELGEHARPLGEELANALGVPVTESE
jgi:hypothetical protein